MSISDTASLSEVQLSTFNSKRRGFLSCVHVFYAAYNGDRHNVSSQDVRLVARLTTMGCHVATFSRSRTQLTDVCPDLNVNLDHTSCG